MKIILRKQIGLEDPLLNPNILGLLLGILADLGLCIHQLNDKITIVVQNISLAEAYSLWAKVAGSLSKHGWRVAYFTPREKQTK